MAPAFKILLWLLLFQQQASALMATPGSSCEALCRDETESAGHLKTIPSAMNASDIVCDDPEYSSTKTGIKFKKCTDCLQSSRAFGDGEADVAWLLYNLRYSVNVCLYGFSKVAAPVPSPCDIDHACQPLQRALEAGNLGPKNGSQLDYCDANGGGFAQPSIDHCVQCLQSSEGRAYTVNFLIALEAGCRQKPQPGDLIGLSGSLFTAHQVNITAPPKNEPDPSTEDSLTGMTTGVVVGICIGAGLLLLGGAALFVVYYRKQKRQLPKGYRRQSGSYSMTPPPIPAAYNTYDSRGTSAMSQYTLNPQAAYGNNADYYTQMEKDMHSRHANFNLDPNQASRGPSSALPTHPAYIPRPLGLAAPCHTLLPPPQPTHPPRPDTYPINMYINSAPAAMMQETGRVLGTSPPPPPPPPAVTRGVPISSNSTEPLLPKPGLPPPPPRAPRLSLPSVRKLRVPKQYSPPQITVQEPTPTIGEGEVPIGIRITGPLVQHHQRYPDETLIASSAGVGLSYPANGYGEVRQQHAIDRRGMGDIVEIHTGKSSMYG